MTKPSRLESLLADVEADGFEPGTEEYEREVRARKVMVCRSLHAVQSCYDCSYHEHCDLLKAYMRDLAEFISARKK